MDNTLQRVIAPDDELLKQHAANVNGLSRLPEEIRKAYTIKRALTRRLRWRRLVRFLHR